MKKWILYLLISIGATNTANAIDCNTYQDKIRKLEDLRRHGGSLKQMERWRMKTDELSSKRSLCTNQNPIQIATGNVLKPSSTSKTTGSKNVRHIHTPTLTSAVNQSPSPAVLPTMRSLKECIKPNNLIDGDVQECRQGLREPSWNHPK